MGMTAGSWGANGGSLLLLLLLVAPLPPDFPPPGSPSTCQAAGSSRVSIHCDEHDEQLTHGQATRRAAGWPALLHWTLEMALPLCCREAAGGTGEASRCWLRFAVRLYQLQLQGRPRRLPVHSVERRCAMRRTPKAAPPVRTPLVFLDAL